ncbi:unnamed protein product, partial [Ectocarpus fasciculatus]
WLFFWFFGWAAAHGRFMSLFLQERGLDEQQIGAVLSITSVISIVAAPVFCSYADKLVNSGNKKGYELVLIVCVIVTTLVFFCHVVPELGLLDRSHDFYFFLFLRVIYSIALAPAYPILDGVALNYLIDNGMNKAAFGRERLYGAYGWAVFSFILGICIDYFETKIMYVFITGLMVALVYSLIIFSKSREFPSGQGGESSVEMSGDFMALPESEEEVAANGANDEGLSCMGKVKSDPNYIVLCLLFFSPLAVMFVVLHTVLSGVTSIVESLVFLFFRNSLGASNLIMGFSVVVTVVFEIPMFAYSKQLLDIFGQNYLIIIACISYCVRVIGYTLAPNGIWVLLVEPLHGVTYASSKISTVDFVSDVTPDHMQATAQGILSSLSAIGKLVGVLLGGYFEEKFGADVMYQGSAALMFAFLIAFVL